MLGPVPRHPLLVRSPASRARVPLAHRGWRRRRLAIL